MTASPWLARVRERRYYSRAMGNVINLNKFRKRKEKEERAKRADTNRRLHGRTKIERQRDELQKQQLQRGLEGKRLEKAPPDSRDD